MEQYLWEKLNRLTGALSTLRIPLTESEYQLHECIAAALRSGGFDVCHEVRLASRCRIDFLIDGIGIEVKRGKPQKGPLLRQCARYLESDEVEALILVVDRSVHLPDSLAGKPLVTFGLNRLWGVALP